LRAERLQRHEQSAQAASYSPLVGPARTPPGIVAFLYREPNAPPLTLALIERGQQRYRIFCALSLRA
jgi:hypothetical protein